MAINLRGTSGLELILDDIFLMPAVSDHSQLSNRDKEDQHPIESITGLKEALEKAESPTIDNFLTDSEIDEILNK